jgi:hypothetical protein
MSRVFHDGRAAQLKRPLRLGLFLGLIFGAVNQVFSWLFPLEDDTIVALLRFYGPMFFVWAFASFRAARRNGRLWSGVATGVVVAFATFCVFDFLNLVRVNLFLDELTRRADWQSMMGRFRASESDSLRTFVTVDYIKDAPLKIGAASVIGAVMGVVGGSLGRLRSWLAAVTA